MDRTDDRRSDDGTADATRGTDARERAEDLAEDFLATDAETVDDRTVRATVTRIESEGDSLRVAVELPDGTEVVDRLARPAPWSTRYRFARVVEETGYGPGSFHHLVGDRVRVERVDGEWRLADPGRWRFFLRRNRRLLVLSGVAFVAVALAAAFTPMSGWTLAAFLVVVALFAGAAVVLRAVQRRERV